jgi:hypothetical protein
MAEFPGPAKTFYDAAIVSFRQFCDRSLGALIMVESP